MKKLLVIGLVIILVVTISAGAVFAGAGGDTPPSITVTKFAEAISGGVLSNVTISNLGGLVNATVTNVTDTVYWQNATAAEDEWTQLVQYEDEENVPVLVAAGEMLELVYEIPCEVPEDAALLKNVVQVQVEGTEVVEASCTFEPLEDEEIDEPDEDADADTGGKKVAFQAGNSHCWHFTFSEGASGRLNCQIKDGKLIKGVFNGKGLTSEGPYCLMYGEVCLGSGYANKGGKVHITVAGDTEADMSEPDVGLLELVECET